MEKKKMKIILLKLNILFYLIIIIVLIIINKDNKKIKIEKDSLIIRLNLSKQFNKIYSILYDLLRSKNSMKMNKNYKNQIYNIKKNKGICACVEGKNENKYLVEFVEYYKNIGFDKIIIFDNNEINSEKLEDILQYYLKINFIEIINIRDLESIQIPLYNYCYQKNKNNFDWIFFVDFDEFLLLKTIRKFINIYIIKYLKNANQF